MEQVIVFSVRTCAINSIDTQHQIVNTIISSHCPALFKASLSLCFTPFPIFVNSFPLTLTECKADKRSIRRPYYPHSHLHRHQTSTPSPTLMIEPFTPHLSPLQW